MRNKPLYIFTESYPYGKGEVFFETELKFLARRFDNIIIIPRKAHGKARKTPKNIRLSTLNSDISLLDYLKSAIFGFFFITQLPELFASIKRFGYKNIFKSIITFYGYCLESDYVKNKLKSKNIKNSVFYCYWMKHPCLGVSLFDELSNIKISRVHGGDVFERNYALPFRNKISEKIDIIYSVSQKGADYLVNHYGIEKSKVKVARLGTERNYPIGKLSKDVIRSVSCSNCIPLKRVDLIVDSMIQYADKNKDLDIEHYHFGNGELLEELKRKYSNLNGNIRIHFMGRVINDKIQKFYSEKRPNIFLNLSTSEGVPVSIMEAISYGIPVVATDVGGNSEIVTNKVGILVQKNISVEKVSNAVEKILKSKDLQQSCIKFWEDNYKAINNFTTIL